MKHFQRLGFIEYTPHQLRVHLTLQTVVEDGDGQAMPARARAYG